MITLVGDSMPKIGIDDKVEIRNVGTWSKKGFTPKRGKVVAIIPDDRHRGYVWYIVDCGNERLTSLTGYLKLLKASKHK
jgi:hypothetical protein